MLQHRLFNLTPNMLEVDHPKRSFVFAKSKVKVVLVLNQT